jgi:hypothetical protein
MRKIVIALVFLTANLAVYSQDTTLRVNEFGVGFSSLTNFSLRYQWGTDNTLFRITAVSLGATNSNVSQSLSPTANNINYSTSGSYNPTVTTPINFSGGLNLSLVHIKPVSHRFGFMFGFEVGINVSYSVTNTDVNYYYYPPVNNPNTNYSVQAINSSYEPFIGVVVGARFKISKAFSVFAEIAPNVNYTYATSYNTVNTQGVNTPMNTTKTANTFGLSGLANSGAFITIMYRIKG